MPEIDYGHQMNPWARPRYEKEDNHREYLEHKREIMEMDERSAAIEVAKGDD